MARSLVRLPAIDGCAAKISEGSFTGCHLWMAAPSGFILTVVAKRKGADPREPVAVASLAEYGALIRSRPERTIDRIRAMQSFDELCHRAYAGLYPNPKFERGVDVSKSLPGVPDDRADGLREMQALTARIGVEAQALLFHRVYERQTFTWMAGQGMGDERRLAVLFLMAADAVGRFYGFGRPSKAVEAMERVLESQPSGGLKPALGGPN